MNRTMGISIATLALVLTAGCSDIPLGSDPAEAPAIRAIASSGKPKMGKVAVAPITTMSLASDEVAKHWNLADTQISASKVQQDIARALEASGSYEHVRLGKGAPGEEWSEHDDFVVRVAIDKIHTQWDGHNGWWGPNIANFLVWGFPAWWVADAEFSLSGEVTVTVSSAESGQSLPAQKLAIESRGTFDQWDRGWHFFGTFYTSFEPEEWRGIAERLFPRAESDLAVAVASAVERSLRGATATPVAVQKLHQKTLALAVGLSSYQDNTNFPPVPFAADDARRVAAALEHAGLPGEHVRTLVDSQVTAASVRSAIAEHLGRARESDSVLVYVAGYGTRLQDGRGAILMNDATRGGAGGTLLLDDLANDLAQVRGQKLVVIDAGFGDHGRAIASKGAAPADDLAPFQSRGIAAILAGGPADPALAPEDLGSGLLTFYFVQGIEGKADLDHDGHVPAQELYSFVRPRVVADAAYVGDPQAPRATALDKGPTFDLTATEGDKATTTH